MAAIAPAHYLTTSAASAYQSAAGTADAHHVKWRSQQASFGFRVGLSPSRAIVPPALVWAEEVGTMRDHELYATILCRQRSKQRPNDLRRTDFA